MVKWTPKIDFSHDFTYKKPFTSSSWWTNSEMRACHTKRTCLSEKTLFHSKAEGVGKHIFLSMGFCDKPRLPLSLPLFWMTIWLNIRSELRWKHQFWPLISCYIQDVTCSLDQGWGTWAAGGIDLDILDLFHVDLILAFCESCRSSCCRQCSVYLNYEWTLDLNL